MRQKDRNNQIRQIILRALKEDIGSGDAATLLTVPKDAVFNGEFIVKEEGIVAGIEVAKITFKIIDKRVTFTPFVKDGDWVEKGSIIAKVKGPGRALLSGERVALNFLQRMSGIATLTHRFVESVKSTKAIILDTRKTAPGLRIFDRWAVRLGDGRNHRFGLDDMIIIKDNHIAAVGSITKAVEHVRFANKQCLPIEVEVKTIAELKEALLLKPDRIMLDNMSQKEMREAVRISSARVPLEASGNVTLENIANIAATGVDFISTGMVTHSPRALDISLKLVQYLKPNPSKSAKKLYQNLKKKLHDVVPEFELYYKSIIADEINQLKVKRNAVILGHNYMEPALFHSIPDFVGDSLELSRKAAKTDKDVIVFCGVKFMAETAKILNPSKTVLIPSAKAGCSLASSITALDVRNLRKQFPGVPVISYVNTYADVKAESDICCTSGNAKAVVESFNTETVIFLPDEYLAGNVAKETGKHIIFPTKGPKSKKYKGLDYQMIGWHGRCEVHEKFTIEDIKSVRKQFPDVVVLAHPECSPDVVAASDFSGSTTAMTQFVETIKAPRYLLLTECSMADNIIAANPKKDVLRLCSIRCPYMSEITLEDTRNSLLYNQYEINIPEDIRIRAEKAVKRMIAIG